MLQTIISVAPLFLLIALGRVLFQYKIANINWVQVFNSFTLKLGFPAMIFSALYHSEKSILDHHETVLYNSGYLLFILLFGILVFNKAKARRSYIFCLIFSNIAFLGIPITKRIYGSQSIGETGVIASVYLFWIFTIGVIFLEISKKRKLSMNELGISLIKNPLLIAIMIGVLIQLTQIRIPQIINESIVLIADAVTPIVLLSLGIFTGTISFNKPAELKPVLLFSLLTLVIAPLFLYLLSNFTSTSLELSIIEAAMPVAVAPFAMADDFGLNKRFIAQAIIISTVISPVSLSLWHHIL
jgi:predicted permease